jgi:ketosteroid isomerase-like protein
VTVFAYGILRPMIPEESTTSDSTERLLAAVQATINRHDSDAVMGFFAPDAVVHATEMGTSFEDVGPIRGFLEEWRNDVPKER